MGFFCISSFDASVHDDGDYGYCTMHGGFSYDEHDEISTGWDDYYNVSDKFAFRCNSWTSSVPFCITVMSAESYRP